MRLGIDNGGMTLVEVLLVVGILAAIAAAVIPGTFDAYRRYQLEASASELVHALRQAQGKGMNAHGGSAWSVRLEPGPGGRYTVYHGTDFAERDVSYDERYELPAALSLSDTIAGSDIAFRKVVGSTEDTGTVTISWTSGNESRTVSVNAAGVIESP